MKRLNGRLVRLILAGLLALLAVQGVRASDIPCNAPVGGPGARCEEPYGSGVGCDARSGAQAGARKGHLICEYTMLSQRYERIYAEQQRMLHKGTLQAADIAAWRARRDACDSVRCFDSIFHSFWRQRDAMPKSAGKPAIARQGAAESPGAASHEAASRSVASPGKAASRGTPASAPVSAPGAHVASAASRASVASAVAAAPVASAGSALAAVPDANVAAVPVFTATPQPRVRFRPKPLLVESLVSGLAVLGVGAGFVWNRRRAAPQAGGQAKRPRMPSVMKITVGLLLVNVLLLPFTLGLR